VRIAFKAFRFGAYTTIVAMLVLSLGSQAFAKEPASSKNHNAALTDDNSKKVLA